MNMKKKENKNWTKDKIELQHTVHVGAKVWILFLSSKYFI